MTVKITTKYNWRWDNKGSEESFIPSYDGSIVVSRDIPSSADYFSLEVGFQFLTNWL